MNSADRKPCQFCNVVEIPEGNLGVISGSAGSAVNLSITLSYAFPSRNVFFNI